MFSSSLIHNARHICIEKVIVALKWAKVFLFVFLAAMSSSRSGNVTKSVSLSVCVSGVILLSMEHSELLKQDVFRELQGCLRGVCLKVQGCFCTTKMLNFIT